MLIPLAWSHGLQEFNLILYYTGSVYPGQPAGVGRWGQIIWGLATIKCSLALSPDLVKSSTHRAPLPRKPSPLLSLGWAPRVSLGVCYTEWNWLEPGDLGSSPCPVTTVFNLDKSFELSGPHTLYNEGRGMSVGNDCLMKSYIASTLDDF